MTEVDRATNRQMVATGPLASAAVSDSLDALGVRGQVMEDTVRSFDPVATLTGRARTARFVPDPSDSEDPYEAAIAFVDSLQPGDVAVIACGGDHRTAYWGELFSAAATGRGAVGTVVDGPVRDVAKILALGYPVFAAGRRPLDFRARMRLEAVDVPVRCAGVPVSPGDWVIGDRDGVVVVPAVDAAAVAERAGARLSTEGSVLAALSEGASLRAVWTTFGVL